MSVHEQFADDLSLYALGALQGEERSAVERHLEECPDCRHELARLQGSLALLAFSVTGSKPPARSRERLITAIAKEPRRAHLIRPPRRAWWTVVEWVAAVAFVAVISLLLTQNSNMRRRVAEFQSNSMKQQQELLQAKQLIESLTAPDAVHFTLVAGKVPPQPQGKAIYVRKNGTLVFLASNMPVLPAEKIYELWLIPTSGAPIPAGLFRPDAHGTAAVVKPAIPTGVEAKTFAITVEPSSGSSAPTTTPIMVGVGE